MSNASSGRKNLIQLTITNQFVDLIQFNSLTKLTSVHRQSNSYNLQQIVTGQTMFLCCLVLLVLNFTYTTYVS